MLTLEVEVSEDDIDNGKPRRHCLCPVALAVKRKLGMHDTSVDVSVGGQIIVWERTKAELIRRYYRMPSSVSHFISIFDTRNDLNWQEVQPFSFVAELVEVLTHPILDENGTLGRAKVWRP